MSAPTQTTGVATRGGIRGWMQQTQIGGRSLGWYLSGWRLGVFFGVLAFLFPQIVGGISPVNLQTWLSVGIPVAIYVMLAQGLNIVVGYAGLLDLGYVAFYVIGAYTAAAATNGYLQNPGGTKTFAVPTFPFWLILPAGAIVAGLFGVLLGAPTLRLRGDYLAIVTLGFGEILPFVFQNQNVFFGNTGISVAPPPDITTPLGTITLNPVLDLTGFYYLALILAMLVIFASLALRDSSLGRAWVAIREDETAAASSGVNLVRTKLLAFATGAAIGGIGGVLFGSYEGAIEPIQFNFAISITILIMVVLGGLGSVPGVILGAMILEFINVYLLQQIDAPVHSSPLVTNPSSPLHFLAGVDFNQAKFLIYGIVLVLMILLRPQGLIPDRRRARELHGVGAAPEAASSVGLLEREEAGIEVSGGVDAEDSTTYAGSGADDQGREGQ